MEAALFIRPPGQTKCWVVSVESVKGRSPKAVACMLGDPLWPSRRRTSMPYGCSSWTSSRASGSRVAATAGLRHFFPTSPESARRRLLLRKRTELGQQTSRPGLCQGHELRERRLLEGLQQCLLIVAGRRVLSLFAKAALSLVFLGFVVVTAFLCLDCFVLFMTECFYCVASLATRLAEEEHVSRRCPGHGAFVRLVVLRLAHLAAHRAQHVGDIVAGTG